MNLTARIHQAAQDAPTLSLLQQAEQRSADPGRLLALYGLVGEALRGCEALLPELLTGAPVHIRDAALHLLSSGGKRVRPLLLALSARACQEARPLCPAQLVSLMAAAELTHTATLLHDDVLDDAQVRRGQDAARVRWGNAVSVLAGDFLLTRALEEIAKSGLGEAMPAMLATIRRMIEGEAVQLSLRGRSDATQTSYYQIVEGKTASLFAFCGRIGALAAGAHTLATNLESYARHLGLAFQIVDDVLDIEGDPRVLGKAVMADLREGKLTLPVLLALEAHPELQGLMQPGPDDTLPEHTVVVLCRTLKECHAIKRARAVAAAEAEKGCAALSPLPDGPCKDALWQIAQEVVGRSR